jgi:hypothetical protein
MADITVTTDFSQVNNLKDALNSADSTYVKVVNTVVRENNRLKNLLKMAAKDTADTNKIKEQSDVRYAALLQREADKQEKARARVAANAEKEAKRIEAANQKLIASEVKLRAELEKKAAKSAQNFQAQVGPNLGLGAQGISAGASASAIEGEIERLRTKYDQIYASSQLYEKSLKEVNQAHMLGAISAKQHEAAVESLNLEYQNFQNGVAQAGNRFANHVNQASTGLNKFGVVAQQTGYQVSDFLVQVQGGTNPLVAFSQQATQLAGLLYLLPQRFLAAKVGLMGFTIGMSAIAAGVTIGIPLLAMLAMSFFNSGEKADKAAKDIDRYKQALDGLKSATEAVQTDINKVTFGTEDPAIANARQNMRDAQVELQKLQADAMRVTARGVVFDPSEEQRAAIAEAKEGYRELTIELNKLLFKQTALSQAQNMLNGGLSVAASIQKNIAYWTEVQLRLKKEAETIKATVTEGVVEPQKNLNIQKEYQRLLQAGVKPIEAQAAAQYKVERALIQSKIASGQLTNEQKNAEKAALVILDTTYAFESQIRAAAGETSLLEEGLSQSVINALKLEGVDLTNLSDGALSAAALATNLGISLGLAREIGKISALSPEDRSIYTGVKTGVLPDVALGSIGMGVSGFTNDANAPIEIPGVMTPNPDKPKKGGGGDKKDPLGDLQKQLELERELLGTSEAYQKVRQALGDDFRKTSPEVIAGLVQQATEIERLIELEEQRKSIMDTVKSSLEDGFMSMVDGTKSVKDAFKSMAAEIIKELYRVYVVQQIVGAVTGGFGGGGKSFFSAPSTGSFGLPFGGANASGGSMIPGKSYLVGENGPELVIPRHSGTVVNANQTANAAGGNGTTVVNNNISVTGSDAAMVRAEVAKMIPQITNATKAAVIDARLRGGQMKSAFR